MADNAVFRRSIFFNARRKSCFFRAEGYGKYIFAGKLNMRLCNPAGIQGKFRALRLFYECGQKENFGTHFLAGNFILRNMCQLLRFYLQVFLFFQRVRQKSPFGLSKKFSSPASEKCNPNQVSTPFTLILRLFCLVCGQQVTHIYNL